MAGETGGSPYSVALTDDGQLVLVTDARVLRSSQLSPAGVATGEARGKFQSQLVKLLSGRGLPTDLPGFTLLVNQLGRAVEGVNPDRTLVSERIARPGVPPLPAQLTSRVRLSPADQQSIDAQLVTQARSNPQLLQPGQVIYVTYAGSAAKVVMTPALITRILAMVGPGQWPPMSLRDP